MEVSFTNSERKIQKKLSDLEEFMSQKKRNKLETNLPVPLEYKKEKIPLNPFINHRRKEERRK